MSLVGHNDDVVVDASPHVDKVGNLAVQPVHSGVDYEIKLTGSMFRPDALDDRKCVVPWVLHAKDDLNGARIVLGAKRSEVLKQARLGAVQRLENSHPRHRRAARRRSLACQAIGQDRCSDQIAAADDANDPRDNR
jgi:hypothetical protein